MENSKSRHETDIDLVLNESKRLEVFAKALFQQPELTSYFIDVKALRNRVAMFKELFLKPDEGGEIAYAVKANRRLSILKILFDAGITTYECASPMEIETVKKAIPTARILLNHPITSNRTLDHALKNGVRHFTVQSERDVDQLRYKANDDEATELEIAVRIATPNPNANTDFSEKFGTSADNAEKLLKKIRNDFGDQGALSMHTGSQNTSTQSFIDNIELLTKIARNAGGVKSINIGGGLPSNYLGYPTLDLSSMLESISSHIRKQLEGVFASSENPRVIIEPGRSVIAEAIEAAIPVIRRETRGKVEALYIADGRYKSFASACMHGFKLHANVLKADSKRIVEIKTSESTKTKTFKVFGETCDSLDELGEMTLPEETSEGDWLLFPTIGAYSDVAGSEFNGFELPIYVEYNH